MSEIKLENLDDSFFEDLREGNFILVLGAGFSFGVPNKVGGTIPIGDEFKEITKKRFADETATDYQSAAQVWRTKIRGDGNLLNELKNHFLVDETKFDKNLYSSIFIPKWYNIYTLNFDNVLDIALKGFSTRNFQKFSYPKSTGGSYKPDIFHLHGEIDNILDIDSELIFTPESYTKFDTEVSHDLYDVLHSDVKTLHKIILILGSQFKEPVILKKFFKTLPEDKSVKIYHFDIENYNLHSDNFANCDTTFVKLDKAKGGTKYFLQFLQACKDKIENIQIEGTDVINSTFKKRIREGKVFTKTDFYTAKQDESCQWYGIINNYDVVRNDYNKIKGIAKSCFDKPRTYKVAAVVYGFGGSGKSTLLRRLAVELSNESFKIIWAKDREFEQLTNEGLTQIQNDPSRKYLVIIEDWYRLTDNLKEKAKDFLLKIQTLTNIRVIIGDREILGKDYINNLPEKSNIFRLESTENEKIIAEIIELHPEWKDVKENILKKKKDYNTSLFLLLFVIARVSNEESGNTEIDFSEPAMAFRSIVKSDLKKIDAEYPGMAKALHNWACIYTNYKIFIDFETFLCIADAYNGNNDVSNYLKNWNANSPLLDRVKNYISIGHNTSLRNKKLHEIKFIQFNHDKLAEEGLSVSELEGWHVFYDANKKKYDDVLLKQYLDIIINKGDNYISSVFLRQMLWHQKQIFADRNEMLSYINLLLEKGNLYTYHLNCLANKDLNLTPSKLKEYLDILAKRNVYPLLAWKSYFKNAGLKEKHWVANNILENTNITLIPHYILVIAFNYSDSDIDKQQAAQKILSYPNITSLQYDIIIKAFNQPENNNEKQQAALKILSDPNISFHQPEIVLAAFNQKGNEAEKQQAAQKILSYPNITSLQYDIIIKAFNQPENNNEKQQAALKILSDTNITLLQSGIVSAAFNQKGYDEKSKQEIEKAKHEAAIKILEDYDWDRKKDKLMFQALRFFSTESTYPHRVNELVTEIINQFHQHKFEKDSHLYYKRLNMIVGYPFHSIPLWKDNCLYYISNWRNKKTISFFVKVLHSFRSHPEEIKAVCEQILKNWKIEVVIEIRQLYGEAHKGDHIKIALGHPNLKEIAMIAAKKMAAEEENNPNTLPGYLLEIVLKIVQEKPEFPEWDKNTENEFNTQLSE